MAKVSTSISIDAEVKDKAQKLFAEFGMDLSTAINVFLKQAVYERSIPFPIHRELPNEATLRAMDDAETGEAMHGPYHSVAEMMEDLNAYTSQRK